MFGLVPWNKGLRKTGDETGIDSLWDSFFGDGWMVKPFTGSSVAGSFKMDVEDAGKEYLISADMPGVSKDEVSLDFEDGRLTICVNRTEKTESTKKGKEGEPDKNYICRERRFNSMERSVYLEDALSEGATAKMENGVLHVRVPKAEKKEKTYKIDIE